MATAPSRTQRMQYGSAQERGEFALRAPATHLRPYVCGPYCGFVETAPGPSRRRQLPGLKVVLIFDFGPPLRLVDTDHPSRSTCHASGFVAGLHDSWSLTEHDGLSQGLQLNLTPIGARLFFGVPMAAISQRIVELDDLVGAERGISQRLAEAGDWDRRFDLLDRFLTARFERARARTQVAAWAVAQIERSAGDLDIAGLARELGYSQKHLIAQFREHVGLPPKRVARLVRFDRVIRHLRSGGAGTWAEIAARFGYYDQAHLIRDFREFAGGTPAEIRASLVGLPATAEA